MGFLKRITLFLIVNLLVVSLISFLLYLFNVQPFLNEQGINIQSLALFCLAFGIGGSFISLAFSKKMAKWMMGVKIIPPNSLNPKDRWLFSTVEELAKKAGLKKMPEVGIYESSDVNAFATGPSRSNSLVAVSRGLLLKMNDEEAEAVLAHEVSHIANGDMVTMTLLQGIVNAFVMFLARLIAFAISKGLRSKEGGSREGLRSNSSFTYYLIVLVLESLFMILGTLVVAKFSRYREFRADRGSAKLAGKEKMIKALEALKRIKNGADRHEEVETEQKAFQALQISSRKSNRKNGLFSLLATHPPLEERILALETAE